MNQSLVYATYASAGAIALALYWGLPKEGRRTRPALVGVLTAIALGGLLLLLGRLLGEGGGRFYFVISSLLAVFAGVRVVTHSKPVYSALYFVLVVLSTAALMVLAGAEFLAAALVIVYAGAILVTYVFVIMLAQQSESRDPRRLSAVLDYDRNAREPLASVLAGFVLTATVGGIIVQRQWHAAAAAKAAQPLDATGNTLAVGRALFLENGFPVSVQLAGVLLMVAMVGAIVIAKKQLPRPEDHGEVLPPGETGKRVKPF